MGSRGVRSSNREEVPFATPPEPLAIDQERATAIFRIFQEALTNAARH
jgi:signal transduction histidine kinase